MKAKELTIGDWVSYKGIYTRVALADFGIDDGHTKWREEIEPIPLTSEILEKNGFVVESRYYHGNPLQCCVLVDGLWIDISGENYFEGQLEYAHQLQQALRLCGIEKEIIL